MTDVKMYLRQCAGECEYVVIDDHSSLERPPFVQADRICPRAGEFNSRFPMLRRHATQRPKFSKPLSETQSYAGNHVFSFKFWPRLSCGCSLTENLPMSW